MNPAAIPARMRIVRPMYVRLIPHDESSRSAAIRSRSRSRPDPERHEDRRTVGEDEDEGADDMQVDDRLAHPAS